jgi:signal transduction histidine kinase
MQQADSLRESAHKPDSPAVAVAMMTATIGSTAPGSTNDSKHDSTHGPKAKTASPTSPQSEDTRRHEGDRIAPERIRTGRDLTSPNLMRPDQTSPDLMRAATLAATLAALRSESETLTEVAHDARNMVTALGLYCEFLEEPGVLATPFVHYGQELRLVAAASRRLVEKIVALDYRANAHQTNALTSAQTRANTSAEAAAKLAILNSGLSPAGIMHAGPVSSAPAAASCTQRESETFSNPNRRWDLLPTVPIANLAAELAVNRNLLAALAGPSIALTVHAEGCARPVWLSGEDLTRVLVNLVKNSAEAMLSGGRIDIGLREIGLGENGQPEIGLRELPPEQAPEQRDGQGAAGFLLLTVEDDGPGIPAEREETIFASGFTSHGLGEGRAQGSPGAWSPNYHDSSYRGHGHRGLGLTISRSIVEGAGGRITAANREPGGARFALELPLRQASSSAEGSEGFLAGSTEIK